MILKKNLAHLAVYLTAAVLAAGSAPAQNLPARSTINISGQGFSPSDTVVLTTGVNQNVKMQADMNGAVSFSNLAYVPSEALSFSLSFNVKAGADRSVPNDIAVNLDPYVGSVNVRGTATPAASVVLNVSDEDSGAIIANQYGQFSGQATSLSGFSQGGVKILTSIINVAENCCPRSLTPLAPVTITISGQPIRKAQSEIIETISTAKLDIVKDGSFAGSVYVPPETINNSWVAGFQEFGNKVKIALLQQAASLGSFFDAQNNAASQLALQKTQMNAAKNYLPSEALCRFGSLSQSLVASESAAHSNKLAFLKTLNDRESGTRNTLTGTGKVLESRLDQLYGSNCDPSDSNSGLRKACKNNEKDENFNQDADYTRLIDVPVTLNADFLNPGNAEDDEENILSLSQNLFPSQTLNRSFDQPDYLDSSTDFRSLQAIRNVAKNSFASIIGEKTRGTAGSSAYIVALMNALGVPSDQAKALMGANPSYFAQMEVLTKKLYQDPAFYVNLVDTSANVSRQRAAMRAIKLQQQRGFTVSVKRREMLLAMLLELKLRERSAMTEQRLSNSGQ